MVFFNNKYFFFILFNIFSISFCSSQKQNDEWININHGLPTNHVYASQKEHNDYLWFTTEKGVVKYNGSSFKQFSTEDGLPTNDIFGIYIDTKNRKWIDHVHKGLFYIENDSVKKVNEFSQKNSFLFINEKNDSLFFSRAYKRELYVFVNNKLFNISNNYNLNISLTKKRENRLNNLKGYSGKTKNLLEGRFFGNYLYYITKNNKLYKRKLEKNVYSTINSRFTNLKKSYKFNNNLFFVTTEDSLFKYNLPSKKLDFIDKYNSDLKYTSAKYNDSTLVIAYSQTLEFINTNNLKRKKKKSDFPIFIRAIFTTENSLFYIFNSSIYKNNGKPIKNYENDIRFNKLFAENKNTVLAGNETHLIKYSLDTKITKKNYFKDLLSIASLNHEYIVGTNNGIFFLDKNLLIKKELKTNKKVSNIITYKNYFICSIENEITILKKENKSIKLIYSLDEKDGLINDFITNIQIENNSLFVFYTNGFTEINLDVIVKKELIADIEIERFFNNGIPFNPKKNVIFKRSENNIEITSSIKTKNNTTNYTKFYSLTRNSKKNKWVEFYEPSLKFNELSYGNYTLKIGIKKRFENRILKQKVFHFKITPYIYETKWFIYIIVLLFITLSVYFTLLYRKKEKKKIILSNNLMHSEIKALKAQMNPHFIFNSLNSIQSSFFLKDSVLSNKIFVNFSKLLRTTLEMINQKEITLNEELRYINNYIEVIKTNHKKEIKVEFNIDTSLDLSKINIPTLLLQPIVENSIEHGLLPSIYEKKITISIFSIENTKNVLVEIEDNGVGRNLNKSKKKHTSLGVNLINDRINLLNKLSKIQKLELQIVDLKDNGHSKGTKVILKITKL